MCSSDLQADNLLGLIESLTVEEGASEDASAAQGGPTDDELEEAKELAADILGLPMPERKEKAPSAEDA